MKKTNSQAETHSNQAGPPRDFHRYTQKHTADRVDHHVAFTEASEVLQFCNTYFFLFIYRLQAQAHSRPGSTPRASRKDLFFLFINRLQAQAQAHATAAADQVNATHYFIDSP